MKKTTALSILFWVVAVVFCSLGIALCTRGSFGLSMIAAPPYILSVWVSGFFPWFTQGMGEYVWEGILLISTCIIIRRFKWQYLLSFGTAVAVGLAIDGWYLVIGGNAVYGSMTARIISCTAGILLTSFSVACYFKTTLPLQVYELSVTEISERFNKDKMKIKRYFDFAMLTAALLMALFLTHSTAGIGIGTILVTIVNASIIKFFSRLIDKALEKYQK